MSTRKIIRNGLRAEAERNGYKPSAYVRAMWNKIQIKKYGKNGATVRAIHQAIGTHKRRTWRERILAVVEAK